MQFKCFLSTAGSSRSPDHVCTHRTITCLADGVSGSTEPCRAVTSIAAHPPLAAQMTKRALQVNIDAQDLIAAMELENRNQVIAHTTEESAAARRRWASKE